MLLAAWLTGREIETRWVTAAHLDFLLTGDRFDQVQAQLAAESSVRLSRDLAPICYYYDMVLWLAILRPVAGPVRICTVAPTGVGAAPLGAGVLLLLRRQEWALPSAVAISGLSEMTLSILLILAFQSLHGYVYRHLALIITAIMGGAAFGSWAADRAVGWRRPLRRRSLCLTLTVLSVYAITLPLLLSRPLAPAVVIFPLLAWVAGALGGTVFSLAAVRASDSCGSSGERCRAGGGRLYAADLIEGCWGALVARTHASM